MIRSTVCQQLLAGFVFSFLALVSNAADSTNSVVKDALFQEANAALTAAKAARADILAPKMFRSAMENYEKAETDFEKGKNLDRIREALTDATTDFAKAIETTKISVVTLSTAWQARSDAENADANQYANKLWTEAEASFKTAATKVEDGNLRAATSEATKAEAQYRDAELEAIKGNFLTEARALLDQADQMKAKRYVPITLANARRLLAGAETTITQNRYDTDTARILARSSLHEARHAIYLMGLIEKVAERELTIEELVLNWEKPLTEIASNLDTPVYFDEGYEQATSTIIAGINNIEAARDSVQQDLTEYAARNADLDWQVAQLETELGGVSKERLAMAQRLELQASYRKRVSDIETLFTPEEATVLRKGDDVIIRLTGLSFDSGQAVIRPERYPLLAKVERAIELFPRVEVEIEGHTDSFGSDATNLTLSSERADAVKSYLLANGAVNSSRVIAKGYGETSPVANNETSDGRSKNRRIDVVLHATTTPIITDTASDTTSTTTTTEIK